MSLGETNPATEGELKMTLGFQPRRRRDERLANTVKVYQSITKHAMHKTARRVANEFYDTHGPYCSNVEKLWL
jgi:hypothetical protein